MKKFTLIKEFYLPNGKTITEYSQSNHENFEDFLKYVKTKHEGELIDLIITEKLSIIIKIIL